MKSYPHTATLILKRSDISGILDMGDMIATMESAFRSYGQGKALKPEMMHLNAGATEFHIKGGGIQVADTMIFGLKANGANFRDVTRHYRGVAV